MKIKRETFNELLRNRSFSELFITELGWNNPKGAVQLPTQTTSEKEYDIVVVAQRCGFQILTCEVESMPSQTECRRLDSKLRRQANDYILIFSVPNSEHQCWLCPVTQKREIVLIEYDGVSRSDFLFEKTDCFYFGYDEELTIVDVRERVHHAFAINSEKITKDFYTGFCKEHKVFAEFITGITEGKDRQWYASVMLNRLMFCYFIQKKGFLDGDSEYLSNKLGEVRAEEGEDKFYHSFYKDFLVSLFHDGLNSPRHSGDWERRFGRIPYLNGGMFEIHQLEQKYAELDIADEAFIRLFAFFDTWQWHLDTRITASGKDINPDVLGYIFEQYINDRAAMGAYYTKEDVTEYISKNCILPYLFDSVARSSSRDDFKPTGFVWQTLKNSGDKYLYDAAKKGYSVDWKNRIPENIAVGLDASVPDLLARRANWNTPTAEQFALPTETWRETVERFRRCDTLLQKIGSGEITQINDFITYNLNIRQFAEDLLLSEKTDRRFVANFYHSLQKITILDPTCGSGAFLFAAMNVLEPLYEICINRMEEFHKENQNLFKTELEEIASKYRSNIQYFIYKSIILHNLYGVDIMVEATEVAKLRLFLKLVAVVEVDRRAENMGLDPLPDIDFNIRCGNTLVGYATMDELNKGLVSGGLYAQKEFMDKIENEMCVVSKAYEAFKNLQMSQNDDIVELKDAKSVLRTRLSELNETLNRHLHKSITETSYVEWLSSSLPFHWVAEFYEIVVGNGGFDVVIGNPPYVEYSKVRENYKVMNCSCLNVGNLFAYVIEKSLNLSHNQSRNGMIVQMSAFCTPRMETFQNIWFSRAKFSSLAFFDDSPGKLFENIDVRVVIPILEVGEPSRFVSTTGYTKFHTPHRKYLFSTLSYHRSEIARKQFFVIKIRSELEESIAKKLWANTSCVQRYESETKNDNYVYYSYGYRYFGKILNYKSYFCGQNSTESTGDKYYYIQDGFDRDVFVGLLNSSLFFWFYINCSDGHNFTKTVIGAMPFTYEDVPGLTLKVRMLMDDLTEKKGRKICNYKSTGHVEYDEYYPKLSKGLIDEIDKLLAKHYGFTDEELDFIINYDIKYRMGD